MSEDKYRKAFKQFDEDGDGTISPDEMATALRTTFSEMRDSEFENMHKLATMSGSRSLCLEDFVSFMQIMEINSSQQDPLPTRAVQLHNLVRDPSDAVDCKDIAKLNPTEHNLTPEEVNILAIISERLQHRGIQMVEFAQLWRDVQAELRDKQQ